jgi:hypothetical protein
MRRSQTRGHVPDITSAARGVPQYQLGRSEPETFAPIAAARGRTLPSIPARAVGARDR